MISEEDSARKSAPDDLEALIRSPPSRRVLQAPSWLNRISKERAEEFMIDRISDNLSQIIPDNVVQLTVENHLTVEKIGERHECKEAIKNRKREFTFELQKKNLPAFNSWVEFAATLFGMGVAKLRFEYVAQPEIAAKDVKVTIMNDHLSDVSIGSLDTSIEMSMLVNGKPVKLGTISRKLSLHHRFDQVAELLKSEVEAAKQPQKNLAIGEFIEDRYELEQLPSMPASSATQIPTARAEPIEPCPVTPKTTEAPPAAKPQVEYAPKFCLQCGKPLRRNSKFCLKCGAPTRQSTKTLA